MSSILDSVISATENRVRIISEQHDPNQIKVNPDDVTNGVASRSGLPNPNGGGGWDTSEYGITREEAMARIRAANTPEARAAVLQDLKRRAIQRAGLDVSNGRVNVAFANRGGWHDLGVVLSDVFDSETGIVQGGLNWPVEKLPYFSPEGPDGTMIASESRFYLRRGDTKIVLCDNVGRIYQPIQNVDAFRYVDGVLSERGARYEAVGSLYRGEKIFLLVNLPQQSFTLNGKDRNEAYTLFTNPHDGSGCAYCYPTNERVGCRNTLRRSLSDRWKGIRIRHDGNLRNSMADAQNALGLAVQGFDAYKEEAEALFRQQSVNPQHYAADVLDAVLDITGADALKGADVLAAVLQVTEAQRALEAKSFARQIKHRSAVLDDILERYESDRCEPKGTAWAALQAVTESVDHGKLGGRFKGAEDIRASRRLESNVSGDNDDVKQTAYQMALATTR